MRSAHPDLAMLHAAFMGRKRFAALDGLRAVSVVAVVWFHTMGHGLTGKLSYAGSDGVTLFFAISGFLITTLLVRESERHGRIDLRAFYIRRSLRIFPLYYAVLLLYVFAVLLVERDSPVGRQFFQNLPYYATYTSNWFVLLDGRVIFYFAWSLAAEEQFYLLWPPLMRWLHTVRRAFTVVAAIAGALVASELLLPLWMPDPAAQIALRVVLGVPLAIVLGVAFALSLSMPRAFAVLWWPLAATRWHSVFWLATGIAVTCFFDLPRFVTHAALTLLVISCVMREDQHLTRLLAIRPIAYVGAISYGIYLLHMLCKNFVVVALGRVGAPVSDGVIFVATTAVTIVVAGLSFKYFEAYFLALKSRFSH